MKTLLLLLLIYIQEEIYTSKNSINEKNYNFVIRQKIKIEIGKGSEFGIGEDIIEQGVFYIQGQRYIEFPNKKITIKLK